MKMADEIIRELWKIKDDIANEYGCDVKALVAHLRTREHKGDQQVVDRRDNRRAAGQTAARDAKNRGIK
jgi:hypothetical protein